MEKKNKLTTIIPIIFTVVAVAAFVLDLMYKFGNHDTPFIISLISTVLVLYIRKASYKYVFGLALAIVSCMGMAFVFFGSLRLTERLGEWFFLLFVLGLIHYCFAKE